VLQSQLEDFRSPEVHQGTALGHDRPVVANFFTVVTDN
jgi:hypothetical protein